MVLRKACDKYLELLPTKEKVDSIISDERIMIGWQKGGNLYAFKNNRCKTY
jgi:hypothetical protein